MHANSTDKINAAIRQISQNVILGSSVDMAVQSLAPFFSQEPELLNTARQEYEELCRATRYEPFPPVVIREGIKKRSWYPGQQQGDIYWPRLRNRLAESSGLDEDVLVSIEKQTNKIMSLLDPPFEPTIRTRGLVLGYVQSGKTTSFVSLISKAADVGYKFFIVLSGMTDSLRKQTQDRIDELLVRDYQDFWYQLTDRDRDFHESPMNSGNLLNRPESRFIAVVKKNPHRLRRLKQWLEQAGQSVLANTPILIIDDEADQGSINTNKVNARRTSINQLIIDLLQSPKSGYVAYTATPFANLLVDPKETIDLYPRDFIISLPKPDGYFGSEKLFGSTDFSEDEEVLDVIRSIGLDECTQMVPPRKKNGVITKYSPIVGPALKRAIYWFLIATSARRIRSSQNAHSTMLIHTSMQAYAHQEVAYKVQDFLQGLKISLSEASSESWDEIKALYSAEKNRVSASAFGNESIEWNAIQKILTDVLSEVVVVVDNYASDDTLIYSKEQPTTAIAIGGNRLSRGLTLEGLCSSYFVRAASAYDTLLQMGRWFGYRKGYEDLCRIWITDDLRSWFRDLSLVEAEIRQDIIRYEVEGLSPSEVAVRIRSHPSMAITAKAKMRSAIKASMTYSGQSPQTTLFSEDENWLKGNVTATRDLIHEIRNANRPVKTFPNGKRGFTNVDASLIIKFLSKYAFHPDKPSMSSEKLIEYIQGEIAAGSLGRWNVVIKEGSSNSTSVDLGFTEEIKVLQRTKINYSEDGQANLRAVASTGDRLLDSDLSPSDLSERLAALQGGEDANYLKLRQVEFPTTALLCIYPIAGKTAENIKVNKDRERLNLESDLIAISIYFPYALGRYTSVDYMTVDTSSMSLGAEDEDEEYSEIVNADSKDELLLVEGD